MVPPATRSTIADADRSELWEALARAQQRWLATASVTGGDVDLAVARMLTVLCMHREHSWPDAVKSMSEWARPHLAPPDVVFSPQIRGAATRQALDAIAAVLRNPEQHSPLTPLLGVKLAPGDGAGEPHTRSGTRRDRSPAPTRAIVRPHVGGALESLWSLHLPWVVLTHARLLVPTSVPEVDAETASSIGSILLRESNPLDHVQQDRSEQLDAIRRVLNERSSRASVEHFGVLARLALEVARSSIEKQPSVDDRARTILSAVLRAWGAPASYVDDMLRPFRGSHATDETVTRGEDRPMRVLPLKDAHPASQSLFVAWSRWFSASPGTGDETLLRVRAVLDVVVDAWSTTRREGSLATLRGGGDIALALLGQRVVRHFLLDPVAKARLLAEGVATALQGIYRQAAASDLFNTPKKLGARVDGWTPGVDAVLQKGLKELFPWWVARVPGGGLAQGVGSRLRQDLRDLRSMFMAALPTEAALRREHLAQRDRQLQGFASASSVKLVRAAARAAGLSESDCRNLFPSERRPQRRRVAPGGNRR